MNILSITFRGARIRLHLLACCLLALSCLAILINGGFARLIEIFSPFNLLNVVAVIALFLPGYLLLKLSDKLRPMRIDSKPSRDCEEMSSERARELVEKFCEILEHGPFIGNASDLPADKETMVRAFDTYMVDLSVAARTADGCAYNVCPDAPEAPRRLSRDSS